MTLITRKPKLLLCLAVFIFVAAVSLGTADAMQLKLGTDTIIDCDVTVNYGGGWRVSDRDSRLRWDRTNPNPLTSGLNTDDGNENFDQWSMINNKLSLLADIDIQHKNVGIFARPKAFYDHVYMSDNDRKSSISYNQAYTTPPLVNKPDEWSDEVEDAHGMNADILDLFAYAGFDLGGHKTELRVGRQNIFWGNGLFISGIAGAMGYVDVVAATSVGAEVKEILLPTESVFLQFELIKNLALNGFYQWKWYHNDWYEGGSFYSAADFLDKVKTPVIFNAGTPAAPFIIPIINRVGDDDAKDSGQYGIGVTYVAEKLNDTEFGFYFVNYHAKAFAIQILSPNTFNFWYPEDIKAYAFSVDTEFMNWNIGSEISYYQDTNLDVNNPMDMGDYYQAQMNGVYLYPGFTLLGTPGVCTFVGEVGLAQTDADVDDTFAWGFTVSNGITWGALFKALDVGATVTYADNPSGTNVKFTEGSASGSIGLDLTYMNLYKGSIKYTNRFNSKRNSIADRDTIEVKLSYTF